MAILDFSLQNVPHILRRSPKLTFFPPYMINLSQNESIHSNVTEIYEMTQLINAKK